MEAARGVGFIGSGYDDPMDICSSEAVEQAEYETLGYLSCLPKEIFNEVLDYIYNSKGTAFVASLYTNRKWFKVISDPALWKKKFGEEGLPYFDEAKTRKYRGEPGLVPEISWSREYQFNYSTCTLEPGSSDSEPANIRLRKDTHKLQLFYKEIDAIPTTLNRVGTLAPLPKPDSGGIAARFHQHCFTPAVNKYGEEPLGNAFWAFVVLTPLGSGTDNTVEEKLADVKLHPQYSFMRPVERSLFNFDNVVEGHGYIDGPDTYAICEGTVEHRFVRGVIRQFRGAIGGARAPAGLGVSYEVDGDSCGFALLRKCKVIGT